MVFFLAVGCIIISLLQTSAFSYAKLEYLCSKNLFDYYLINRRPVPKWQWDWIPTSIPDVCESITYTAYCVSGIFPYAFRKPSRAMHQVNYYTFRPSKFPRIPGTYQSKTHSPFVEKDSLCIPEKVKSQKINKSNYRFTGASKARNITGIKKTKLFLRNKKKYAARRKKIEL